MLIIFDLDDTLIDTSGALIPLKLKMSLQAMADAGLKVPSFEKAFLELLKIDASSPNGKETLTRFVEKMQADAHLLDAGLREYLHLPEDFSVSALDEAESVLTTLAQEHTLVIVSTGLEEAQHAKMEKAGLPKELFQKIIICPDYNKKLYYLRLLQELRYDATETMVCGDKFDTDLLPAKELKMITVQMLWGRALKSSSDGKADYTIKKLRELLPILEGLKA
ncbi:MAG: HAD family hydrolase [Nanoarchaeota archaeon]|nr:HAD family hydrolase [Nanoarchaeota archaeon]